jgi:hypothetical protein
MIQITCWNNVLEWFWRFFYKIPLDYNSAGQNTLFFLHIFHFQERSRIQNDMGFSLRKFFMKIEDPEHLDHMRAKERLGDMAWYTSRATLARLGLEAPMPPIFISVDSSWLKTIYKKGLNHN